MATDVLSNKFRTTVRISGGGRKTDVKPKTSSILLNGIGTKKIAFDRDDQVAILSTFLPPNFIVPSPKSDFKCARMEDCFYGDPKLTPSGKIPIYEYYLPIHLCEEFDIAIRTSQGGWRNYDWEEG